MQRVWCGWVFKSTLQTKQSVVREVRMAETREGYPQNDYFVAHQAAPGAPKQ